MSTAYDSARGFYFDWEDQDPEEEFANDIAYLNGYSSREEWEAAFQDGLTEYNSIYDES